MKIDYILLAWIVIFIVSVFSEVATASIVSIWFAIGSMCSIAAYFLHASVPVQIIIFFVVSIVCIICIRTYAVKKLRKNRIITGATAVIGKTGIVTEAINNTLGKGTVVVMGKDWSAISEDGNEIDIGALVKIKNIEGVKLIVEKTEEQDIKGM